MSEPTDDFLEEADEALMYKQLEAHEAALSAGLETGSWWSRVSTDAKAQMLLSGIFVLLAVAVAFAAQTDLSP